MRKLLWNSNEMFSHLSRRRSTCFAPLLSRCCYCTEPPTFNANISKLIANQFGNMETLMLANPSRFPYWQQQQRRIEQKSQLEAAFDSAETTNQMIKVFREMEEAGDAFDERELGLASLKIGLRLDREGDYPEKALPFAIRALNALDKYPNKPSLPVAMTLILLGSLNYSLKRFGDSLGYLDRANTVLGRLPDEGLSVDDACSLRCAAHHFLLYVSTAMGREEGEAYHFCTWGTFWDIKVNRKSADKHVALLNFNEALRDCLKTLEIIKYKVNVVHPVDVAHDRRLLGIICSVLEECEKPTEQDVLAHRILKNWNLSSDLFQAEIDAANRMIRLKRYDEAVGILKNVVRQTDKDSGKQALALISMARVLYHQEKYEYCKRCLEISMGILDKRERISLLEVAEAFTEIIDHEYCSVQDFRDCKMCLQNSLDSLCKREGISPAEVAEAYSEISMQYETMNEFPTAIWLQERLLDLLEKHTQVEHLKGSVSARMGQLLLLTGKVQPAILYLEDASERLKGSVGSKHFGVAYVYINLGMAYLELDRPQLAEQVFAEAKDIMDVPLGPHHPDAVEACQNLSKTYGEMGRFGWCRGLSGRSSSLPALLSRSYHEGKALSSSASKAFCTKPSLSLLLMGGSLLSKQQHFIDSFQRFNDSLGYLDWEARALHKSMEGIDLYSASRSPRLHAEITIGLANWVKEEITWLNFNKIKEVTFGKDITEENLEKLRNFLEIKATTSEELGKANRDLAEAYAAVLSFGQALPYCLKALEIREKQLGQNSVEVASDRKLLGFVYSQLEEHERALEQNVLAQKIWKECNLNSDLLQAEVDAANVMIAAGRHDEAVITLKNVVQQTDKDSEIRVLALISIARALCNQEKFVDCKRYLEISLGILDKRERISPVEVSEAYTKISMQYEAMNEFVTAISLLKRALALLERHPQEQHSLGMISARIGSLLLLTGKVQSALFYLEGAAERLSFGVGHVYNNLGVAYLELDRPQLATAMFELANNIMVEGVDAIEAQQNRAKAEARMGCYSFAIWCQEEAIDAWESYEASAEDELREARQNLEQFKKQASHELHMKKALLLPKKALSAMNKCSSIYKSRAPILACQVE